MCRRHDQFPNPINQVSPALCRPLSMSVIRDHYYYYWRERKSVCVEKVLGEAWDEN